ncbi:SET domain-containing protein [Fragilariopsis cylindrus CCMP1102]|uniref:SET domain-containing protein n=1 Tax=Fragilariopsis cylindrus CCMP1102 TaxID=635003 RepID=A0A1E7ENJ8_9STRA|nr:SET domain-containing protein [Fragilariopsis cylindrus CCMP1102]|eukprot:OEU07520.1 SET domain-containing protein [Fragilariopsis cylindrus CCMP1102]
MAFVIERQQIIQFRSSFLLSITDRTHDEHEKCSNNANSQLTDDPTSKIFLDWMYHQRGCQGEEDAVKILVNEQTGHRGLYVTKDVAEGDYIFAIPFQSAWIVEKEEEDGKNKEKMAEELSDAERGFRFLMWQRRLRDTESQDDDDDNNSWKPYLEIIPTYNNGIHDIASWTTEQIASLELPPIIQRALSKKQNVEELAIPLLDMINHSSEKPNAYYSVLGDDGHDDDGHDDDGDDKDSQLYYAIVADRDIQKNEELLTSYGSEEDSSLDLLLQYGFVPDYNPFDVNFWDVYSQTQTITMTNVIDSCWSTTLEQDEDRLSELIFVHLSNGSNPSEENENKSIQMAE